jgi:Big-like domain-containing protein
MAITTVLLYPDCSPSSLGTQISFLAYAFSSSNPPANSPHPFFNDGGNIVVTKDASGNIVTVPRGLPVGKVWANDPGLPGSLTYVPDPAFASQTAFSWSSSSPAVATIDTQGLLTLVAPGTTTVQATASGVSATATVTVTSLTAPIKWTVTYGSGKTFKWNGGLVTS